MEHTLHQALSSIDHEEGQWEQEEQQLQMDLDFTLPMDLDLEKLIEVIVLPTSFFA